MRTLTVLICAVVLGPFAFSQQNNSPNNNPLIQLLQSKGILSAHEAAAVNQASSPEESNGRLVPDGSSSSQRRWQRLAGKSSTPAGTPS